VTITDGPFLEAKEALAGYCIIDVATPERAEEIASYAASAIPSASATRPGGSSLAGRLIGIARWLHGDRPPSVRSLATHKPGAPSGLSS
jgi:hypothetical protein